MTISSAFHVLMFPTTVDYSLFIWQMCQNMEGSVHGQCGKMCPITTKLGGGNKRTLDAYEILVWRLQFEKWKCKLPKDWDYGFGFSSSRFRNCAKTLVEIWDFVTNEFETIWHLQLLLVISTTIVCIWNCLQLLYD